VKKEEGKSKAHKQQMKQTKQRADTSLVRARTTGTAWMSTRIADWQEGKNCQEKKQSSKDVKSRMAGVGDLQQREQG